MKSTAPRERLDVVGGQPPSACNAASPGGYTAKKDREARFQAPPHKKAKLSHLARSSALRPVPRPQHHAILVKNSLSNLAIYTLAEGTNLFWKKVIYVA